MQFLTREESSDWCNGHGLGVPSEIKADASAYEPIRFAIPKDAGARVALCRLVWSFVDEGDSSERLLWMTDWGVWPSGEHMPLFQRLRLSIGETRPLIDTPGHVCAGDEGDDGLSLLIVSSLFLWDSWIYSPSGVIVHLSHDEYGALYEPRGKVVANRRSELGQFTDLRNNAR